jgi:hypothetical protein
MQDNNIHIVLSDVVDIPSVLLAEDICRIFCFSMATLHRRLKEEYEFLKEESRNRTDNNEVYGRFPLPINAGGSKRRRLIWSRDSIENFLNSGKQHKTKLETSTQRKQRADAARADLQRRGVHVNTED